jgi:hypothetical protein
MNWWLENKYSGAGEYVFGQTFDHACRMAVAKCTTDMARWIVFDGQNRKVAEVTMRGVEWRHALYQ